MIENCPSSCNLFGTIFSTLKILVLEPHVILQVYSLNCSVVFSPFLILKNNHEDYISIKLIKRATVHCIIHLFDTTISNLGI